MQGRRGLCSPPKSSLLCYLILPNWGGPIILFLSKVQLWLPLSSLVAFEELGILVDKTHSSQYLCI